MNRIVEATREMKDSGIEWIGQIPIEWEVLKLGHLGKFTASGIDKKMIEGEPLVKIINYTDVYKNTSKRLTANTDYMTVSAPQYKIDTHSVKRGDLIFTPSSETVDDIGVSAVVDAELINTAFSYHVLRFHFEQEVYHDYKKYICNNIYVQNIFSCRAVGTVRKTLKRSDFKTTQVVLPPLHEQQAIANYLDEQVGKMDGLISEQKQAIEQWKAYKQSLITETVTKGLNPDVEMKDSGVEWIGEIPKQWDCKKIKYMFKIRKTIANSLGYDVLSVTQNGLKIKDISKNEGQLAMDYSKYQIVNPKDFVMNHMDLLTGYVDCSTLRGVTSPDYRVFTMNSSNNHDYYKYIFQLCYINKIFYGLGQGVSNLGRWRLQTESFNNFKLPVPPLHEQEAIAGYLDEKCSKIDQTIEQKQALVKQLEEYKQSLIYECVTGKRCVL